MLSLISASLKYDKNASNIAALNAAFEYLANDNQYSINMINTRINAPCDINFSDDELTFFSYMALFWSCTQPSAFQAAALQSIQRSWFTAVQAEQSSMWGGIYLASTMLFGSCGGPNGNGIPATPDVLATAQNIIWSLRTWSPDLIDWVEQNTQRLDYFENPNADRFGNMGSSLSVIPQYERSQTRWNANPFQLNGGSGNSMSDPGVWLYPYWLARYLQIL